MARRFYSESPIQTDAVTLDGPEAHHLLHVLRASPGDRVVLFDGSGAEFEAEVVGTTRKQVELQVLQRHDVSRELPVELVLAVALPRGDRQEWLVQKAVELGVTRLVPLITERSVAKPNAKSLTRMQRTVIEASKQCRRNTFMVIEEPASWSQYLAVTQIGPPKDPTSDDKRAVDQVSGWIAHLDGGRPLSETLRGDGTSFHFAIGPEGGFSDEEVDAASDRGWHICCLGQSTLRTETAAIAVASYLRLSIT